MKYAGGNHVGFIRYYEKLEDFCLPRKKNASPNLVVKTLKRMHMDMKLGNHADMTEECKKLDL